MLLPCIIQGDKAKQTPEDDSFAYCNPAPCTCRMYVLKTSSGLSVEMMLCVPISLDRVVILSSLLTLFANRNSEAYQYQSLS